MNQIHYKPCGDYLIPDLKLPQQPQQPLSKYGRIREKYLKEHRKGLHNCLLFGGKLMDHLQETDEAAQHRLNLLIPLLTEQAGVTEKLKEKDPMVWTQMMNCLKAQAEEVIFQELIYS